MALLETENLIKEFGGLVATDDVNLTVEEDERVSIIGPNGAGKSTLINLITRRLDPTSGDIRFKGESIVNRDPHEVVQMGVSKSFQTASIFSDLTVRENAEIAALAAEHGSFGFKFLQHRDSLTGVHQVARDTLDAVGLLGQADRNAAELPYGDKRRLEIGMAVALDPDLLLMDEPTAGLPEEELHEVMDFIEEIAADRTILLVEHKMDVVMGLSDRISVLHEGALIAEGTADEIRNDETVQQVYLGEEGQYA